MIHIIQSDGHVVAIPLEWKMIHIIQSEEMLFGNSMRVKDDSYYSE